MIIIYSYTRHMYNMHADKIITKKIIRLTVPFFSSASRIIIVHIISDNRRKPIIIIIIIITNW